MGNKVYKYFSHEIFDLVFFQENYCRVKCSFPQDYNDPFELFLGVDLSVPTELLATYRETVNQIPQQPTTCFSKAPIVAPMWAHYANNHTGFVLEFDVDCMKQSLEEVIVREVSYKDSPNPDIGYMLLRSATTMKPRHVVWLQQAVVSEAYFSKQTAWSYEQECRMVVSKNRIEQTGDFMILPIPLQCVTKIIIGSRADAEISEASKAFANKNDIDWLHEVIGASNAFPFFVDDGKAAFVFDEGEIKSTDQICSSCGEPVFDEEENCAWCRITENDALIAARSNPFRALDRAGLLDNYLASVAEIERNSRK